MAVGRWTPLRCSAAQDNEAHLMYLFAGTGQLSLTVGLHSALIRRSIRVYYSQSSTVSVCPQIQKNATNSSSSFDGIWRFWRDDTTLGCRCLPNVGHRFSIYPPQIRP